MGARVLVVDDDPALLSLEGAILEAQGHDVTLAEGGREAFEKLKGQEFDLVVTDLDMPEIDGMAVLEVVRDVAPETVVIICTSHGRVDVAVQSLRAGAFDFVQKPFSFDHFTSVVERALEHRRLRDQTNIYRASAVVFSTLDPTDLPQVIVETAANVLQSDYAAIFAKGPDGQYAPAHMFGTVRPGAAMMAALRNLCPDVERKKDSMRLPGDARVGSPHGMAIAVQSGSRVHGVLWTLRSPNRSAYAARDVDNAMVIAAQAALAMDNARLVGDLKDRISAMEKARRRIYTSARIEGIGRMAIDVAQNLANPVQYARTNLREVENFLRQQVNGAGRYDDEIPIEEAQRRLDAALEGIARVDQSVTDLASVAQNREKVRFEVGQAVQLAVRLARLRFEVTVNVETDAVIEGAPGQLAQAVAALLLNAEQALQRQPKPEIRVSVSFFDGLAKVAVSDNGEGITADSLPFVFEPFFSTRGRDGLGLNTAREIVEHHGGTVDIRSVVGRGTEAAISLPAEPMDDELVVAED